MKVSIFEQSPEVQAKKVVILLVILLFIELLRLFLFDKITIFLLLKYINLWATIAIVLGVCDIIDGSIENYVEWGFLIGLFIYVPMCSFKYSGFTSLLCIIYGILLTIILSVINYELSKEFNVNVY